MMTADAAGRARTLVNKRIQREYRVKQEKCLHQKILLNMFKHLFVKRNRLIAYFVLPLHLSLKCLNSYEMCWKKCSTSV